MSTETPNLGLEYLDPSQSQPEIKVNDAWNKIDAAVGTGGGVAVSEVGTSPPIVARAREIKFSGGATVTHETDGVAVVHIDTTSGGPGSPIDVMDGTTEVTAVTAIRFTSGAVVSVSSGSVADVAIAGGGGVAGTGAALKLTSNLSVPSGVETPVAWSSAVFDTGGYFSGAHPTRLTVLETGLYQLSAALFWTYAAAAATVFATLIVNGVTTARIAMSYVNTSASLNNASNNLSTLLNLNAGDYVEVFALQNVGTASIAGSAGEELSIFSIARVVAAPVSGPSTVAALPASPAQGDRAFVTDATATTFLSTVAGGGSDKVPVVYDGTNWVIG